MTSANLYLGSDHLLYGTDGQGGIHNNGRVYRINPVISTVDFNGDGLADLILQNASTKQVAIWYLNHTALIGGGYISIMPPAGWAVVGVGDFNGDGQPDLALQNVFTKQVAVWYLNYTTVLNSGSTIPAPANWNIVGPH